MAFRIITIPIHYSSVAEAELNGFLATHRVLAVDRRWVEAGPQSCWSFCVDYVPGAPAETTGRPSVAIRGKVDYREVLSPEEFVLYSRMREWRKKISQSDAVPVYTIFTNDQLAQMVQKKAATKGDLEQIAGVGDARVQKYGDRILEFLTSTGTQPHETHGKPV